MVSHRLKSLPRMGRDSAHRRAMLRNMVTSLIEHERILTTHTKAKTAQRFAERMVAYAKQGTLAGRRSAQAFVRGPDAQRKLFNVLSLRYAYRPCGFTRVVHAKQRNGDNAQLSYLEFVDRPGEIRPSRICTPQSFLQVQMAREANDERQRETRY